MRKSIVLDANLLVLFVVGLTDPAYVDKHKRLRAYDLLALHLLRNIIASSKEVLVTPHALSEASNHLRQIAEPARSHIGRTFQKFIERSKEIYVKSATASSRAEFLDLGLSDSALMEVAKEDVVIVSVDLDLCIAAEIAGYSALNFNHVRDDAYNEATP
jgi:hypothetical protein